MASQPVRPIKGAGLKTIDNVLFGATIAHGNLAVIDPADGQVKAVGTAVTGQVVVTMSDVTSGERGTVAIAGEFLATAGATLKRGGYGVPSNTDTQTLDAGATNDVKVCQITYPESAASGEVVHFLLDPNYAAAGLVS